jgi:DNA repair protein RadD
MSGLRPLYDHQQQALDGLRSSLMAGKTRPLMQASTGFGKTVVAAHMVTGIIRRGKRVCFCVPSLGLIDQTFERFCENGIDPSDMGVIQGDHHWKRPAAPIQIATAQTLSRRELPEVDFVVVDEAHIRFKVYSDWMEARPDVKFIGLSATPWSRGLGKQFDDLVKTVSLSWLIENGYLSKFRVFAPSKPDLTDVRTVKGDYHEGDLEQVMSKPALVADVVETWLMRGDYRPTLCFAVNRKHARLLHEQFASCGVRAEYVDADTPRAERDAIGKRLAAGDVHVVVNIGTLTTGIDWDVRCLILARPTKSESLFVQIIGRALRTAEGKDDALILDHSDTHMRLGMVTEIDCDELDDGRDKRAVAKRKERKDPLPKCCPHCTALMPVLSKSCVECGYEMPVLPGIDQVDGELVAFGGGAMGRTGRAIDALAKLPRRSVFAQLNHIRFEKGRKRGWVAHKYKSIFGNWPSNSFNEFDTEDPIPELLSWVRSEDIRFVKSRRFNTNAGAGHAA